MVAVVISQHLMITQSVRINQTELDNNNALVKEIDDGGSSSNHTIWDDEW